jgi:hypothetical protein
MSGQSHFPDDEHRRTSDDPTLCSEPHLGTRCVLQSWRRPLWRKTTAMLLTDAANMHAVALLNPATVVCLILPKCVV